MAAEGSVAPKLYGRKAVVLFAGDRAERSGQAKALFACLIRSVGQRGMITGFRTPDLTTYAAVMRTKRKFPGRALCVTAEKDADFDR